jgi:hypothetical protein
LDGELVDGCIVARVMVDRPSGRGEIARHHVFGRRWAPSRSWKKLIAADT